MNVLLYSSPTSICSFTDDHCYRKKSHPWEVKPQAARLKRAVRRLRRPGRRVDLPLEAVVKGPCVAFKQATCGWNKQTSSKYHGSWQSGLSLAER